MTWQPLHQECIQKSCGLIFVPLFTVLSLSRHGPGPGLFLNWHIKALVAKLEEVRHGRCRLRTLGGSAANTSSL